ncbi:MAG: FlgD immunoglobulin-like domain containing protein [Candidatus Zixiibacteriota bacterium]
MRRFLLIFLVMAMSTLLISNIAWGQCPEEYDQGECDTLYVIPYKADMDSTPPFIQVDSFPAFVEVLLLVTHDIVDDALDSLSGIVIPLQYTRTNPSAYCSVSAWWNTDATLWVYPQFSRSVFRHIVEGTDTVYYNRQALMARDFSDREWDTRLVEVASDSGLVVYNQEKDTAYVPAHFWFNVVATGSQDQAWWEGSRVLLATVTFNVEDSMTICLDSTWWPPTGQLLYTRYDSRSFIPRHSLPVCFRVGTAGNEVREISGSNDTRPSEFSLSQNYPNPFNPATNIEFNLPKAAHVKIDVFNIVGQRVRTLVDEEMKSGRYLADWDGKDEQGHSVSSGIYFYRMQAGDFSDMKKMLLVK